MSNPSCIVLLDMDDVLADFCGPWLSLYNKEYDHDLTIEDLTEWNATRFVKPECGIKIFDYFKVPGLYRNLPVKRHAKEMVDRLLAAGCEIVIVSDSPNGHSFEDYEANSKHVSNPADDKRAWLREHFPMLHPQHVFFGGQKWRLHGDVIIDDKPSTFEEFVRRGRNAILVDMPYNRHIHTPYRALDLKEATELALKLVKKVQNV